MTEKKKKQCTNHGELYLSCCKICQKILAEQDRVKSGRELLSN